MSTVINFPKKQELRTYSAVDLKAEAVRAINFDKQEDSLAEFVKQLPSLLPDILDIFMADLDYQALRTSNVGLAMRGLALASVTISKGIEENERTR